MLTTVSDNLRVRSKPRVSSDSLRYEPLLPLGTTMLVTAGPVAASGYWWYEVELLDKTLRGGITIGWVAAADHNGTPWIDASPDTGVPGGDELPEPDVLSELPVPILTFTGSSDYVGTDGAMYVRYGLEIVNWRRYPAEMFVPTSELEPCDVYARPSRTWVDVIDAVRDERLNRHCLLTDPGDLATLEFSLPPATPPPTAVYVTLWDRLTGHVLESDTVTTIPLY